MSESDNCNIKVTVFVDRDVWRSMKKRAIDSDLNYSQMVEHAFREYLSDTAPAKAQTKTKNKCPQP